MTGFAQTFLGKELKELQKSIGNLWVKLEPGISEVASQVGHTALTVAENAAGAALVAGAKAVSNGSSIKNAAFNAAKDNLTSVGVPLATAHLDTLATVVEHALTPPK